MSVLNVSWWAVWPNGTVITGGFDTLDDLLTDLDDTLGVSPLEPNPPSQGWDLIVFTRFRTRLYILAIGFILVFGPLFHFAWLRPDAYETTIGLYIMLIGLALMIAAGNI
jgi:hypothetical protein